MTNIIQRGWKDRQAKAQARSSDDEKAEVERIRREHFAELDRQAQVVAEAERAARTALRVSCPCCDGDGSVPVGRAELVIRALEKLSSDSRVDPAILSRLVALASGEVSHRGGSLYLPHGLAHPRPETAVPLPMEEDEHTAADSDEAALAQLDAKPTRKRSRS